jgi:GNAT superfamily N-acetyltransferase
MAILATAEGPLLRQILDASYDLWHDGLSPQAYERFYTAQLATPWGRTNLQRFALIDGDEVLASAKVYAFDATLDGRAVRVAGIGAVFTQPPHRGRGAAPDLLERLLAFAVERGADLALLFSEIGASYYQRLGFTPIATSISVARVLEDHRRGAPATMVRAGEDRDLADAAAMDAMRAAPYRFHLNRSRDAVHYAIAKKRLLAGLSPPGARALQFFIAEEGASAVAYVVVSVKDGQWTLEECGDRDPQGARAGAILQVLVARDPAERRPQIVAWLPRDFCPPQLSIVDRQPARDVMMVRPLTRAGEAARTLTEEQLLYWRSDMF